MKNKKIISFLLSIVCMVMSAVPVFAVSSTSEEYSYRWIYTNRVQMDINFIDTTGYISGSVSCDSDVTKIAGEIRLYYKNWLGLWIKEDYDYTYDISSNKLIIDETFTAKSGRKYKAELEVEVYVGSSSETITDEATGTCP